MSPKTDFHKRIHLSYAVPTFTGFGYGSKVIDVYQPVSYVQILHDLGRELNTQNVVILSINELPEYIF